MLYDGGPHDQVLLDTKLFVNKATHPVLQGLKAGMTAEDMISEAHRVSKAIPGKYKYYLYEPSK